MIIVADSIYFLNYGSGSIYQGKSTNQYPSCYIQQLHSKAEYGIQTTNYSNNNNVNVACPVII